MQCETVKGGLRGNALISATATKLWQTQGFRGLYRGLPMGLIGMFPYSAIDLSTFEYLKRYITKRNARIRGCSEEDAHPGSVATAMIGGCSGALGASLVYPLNLLRTRLQTQGTVVHRRTYTGMADVLRQTLKGEGFKGLFKGLTPNLLKVVPSVSIVSPQWLPSASVPWASADFCTDICCLREHEEDYGSRLRDERTDRTGREWAQSPVCWSCVEQA